MRIRTILSVAILCIEISVLAADLNVTFDPSRIEELFVGHEMNVTLSLTGDQILEISDGDIALSAKPQFNLEASFLPDSWQCVDFVCNRTFTVTGRFLGFGKVYVLQKNGSRSSKNETFWDILQPPLDVTILREDTVLNNLFTVFVATVVTINYINFGCALEMDVVKKVLRRPIGPAVGFVCQFIMMPLVSYGVGYLLFTDPVLRLGLFTFGCSPGGGASNMWTVLLEGNLNLSITMTFISTFAALGTIPIWIFTLGQTIAKGSNIVIPYANIIISIVSLFIPITIGLLIQRFLPKVAALSKRILAPVCITLIIAIIVLASIANTYIFLMLSWSVVIAASLSVWTGFIVGCLASLAFRFKHADVIAVAVETGIQNSGIAFVLLSYSLPHPVSDMAIVIPVAASLITPIPLFIVYCAKKIRNYRVKRNKMELASIMSKAEPYKSTVNMIEDENQAKDAKQ